MNKIIIPTGYMGSGSSALTDIFSEFSNTKAPNGSFEYMFLHCPNGVFDLEDKLLIGNNAIRSDEAIHEFQATMQELYSEKLWWVSNYKKKLSKKFMRITNDYINDLTQFHSDSFWYYQEQRGLRALPKLVYREIIKRCSSNANIPNIPLRYKGMSICFPSKDEFYNASKKYIDTLCIELGVMDHNLILDQMLLPFNAWRMHNYFGENVECFIVERDPRDVFISNKYIWSPKGVAVPFPADVYEFCSYYKKMRESEKPTDSPHTHRIRFEDLIYDYEKTLYDLQTALGFSAEDHIHKFDLFTPANSINNTQLYLIEEFKKESAIIASALNEYLYPFPYDRKPENKLSF